MGDKDLALVAGILYQSFSIMEGLFVPIFGLCFQWIIP